MLNAGGVKLPARALEGARAGDKAALCLRNERVTCESEPKGPCALPGVIKSRNYAGGSVRCVVATDAGFDVVTVSRSGRGDELRVGQRAYAAWDPQEAAVVK